jgi:hypothetical protein
VLTVVQDYVIEAIVQNIFVEAMHVMVKKECTAHTKKELFIGNYIG